jgi:hypothetical protein
MFSAMAPADVEALSSVLPVVVPVDPGLMRTIRDPLACSFG